MFIITVNRDAIDLGQLEQAIIVEQPNGARSSYPEVAMPAGAVIKSGPPRQDGARVWIEAPVVRPVR